MYRTILVDPPWQQPLAGKRKRYKGGMAEQLPYPTLPLQKIRDIPVNSFADVGCHLWLWTTNAHIESGYQVMREWGFKYLAPIHWIKPSGFGNYVIHRTQTLLLGYKEKCKFDRKRYFPNMLAANPGKHSKKPDAFYELIEEVSEAPRLELFARDKRPGWDVWGNEVYSDIDLVVPG